MKTRKLLALLLCAMLALTSGVVACAEEDTVSFSMTSYNTITGVDYTGDAFYDYVADKFNVDIDVWAMEADGAAEKVRIWINGETMPDAMLWEDFDFAEYREYVDQGLLQALPDGWEETWPNLAKLVQVSGYAEALKVDGQTYAIPHSVFGNYLDVGDYLVSHATVYFRKDWAAEVGMENLGDDYTISISELRQYLEGVQAAGLAEMPTLGANYSNMTALFTNVCGIPLRSFMEYEDGFVWCPTMEGFTEPIALMREWYQAGLLDADFYEASIYDYRTAFENGQMAAFYDSGDCVNMANFRKLFAEQNPDLDPYEVVGVAQITNDEGVSYVLGTDNYWTVQVFSPNTDEATLARILDVMDWIASPEGEAACQIGIPGVDWEYAEDGSINLINSDVVYQSQEALYLLGYCNDDFGYSGAKSTIDARDLEDVNAVYAVKYAGEYFPVCVNYNVYNSEAKSYYSVDITNQMVALACNTDDIETSWQSFIDSNESLWKPLLDELNEYYGYAG